MGMTYKKAEYITDFAAKVDSEEFNLQRIPELSDEEAI
jgi:DNA-3-methyladenine glycosylase II